MSRILIADDHAYLRAGLEAVLAGAGHEIVGSVADGLAAADLIARLNPEIAILDVRMPGRSGIEVLQSLREAGDDRGVVLLTAALSDADLLAAVRARVDAIVMKDDAAQVLQQAIAAVSSGERLIAFDLMDRAFALATAEPMPDPLAALSERDRRIAEGVAAGQRNREIAERLGISEGAVKIYLHRIFDRLEVSNRTELALLVARRHGTGKPT